MRSLTLSADQHQEEHSTPKFSISRRQSIWAIAIISLTTLFYFKLFILIAALIALCVVGKVCYQAYNVISPFMYDVEEFNANLEEIIKDLEM